MCLSKYLVKNDKVRFQYWWPKIDISEMKATSDLRFWTHLEVIEVYLRYRPRPLPVWTSGRLGFDVEHLGHVKQLCVIKVSYHGFVKNRSCLHIDKAPTIPHTLSVELTLNTNQPKKQSVGWCEALQCRVGVCEQSIIKFRIIIWPVSWMLKCCSRQNPLSEITFHFLKLR